MTANRMTIKQEIELRERKTAAQQRFVHALATFLVGNQVERSIALQMDKQSAKDWAELRATTPIFGYPTVDEAYTTLCHFLGVQEFVKPASKGRKK